MKGMDRAAGFTLLEMLVALAVFALIAGVCYSALVPAGGGFHMLQQQRDMLDSSYRMDRRLRMDAAYLMRSADKSLDSLTIIHEQRGADSFDTLNMLVADGNSVAPVQVEYAIDEDAGKIVRRSTMAWLRDPKPLKWPMHKASSFQVQALGSAGKWVDTWSRTANGTALPTALRVRWRVADDGIEHELMLPISINGASTSQLANEQQANSQSTNVMPNPQVPGAQPPELQLPSPVGP